LPWPSQTYTAQDPSTATQVRLDLPADGMPVNTPGVPVDPVRFNARWDGFSPTGPMLAMFPGGVSSEGLPSFKNPDDSLAAGSPIVVLDLDRGERAAFFAEVDQNVVDVPSRALVIRPLVRLHEKTHYAVAIRNTVKSADGSPLPVSPGFAALRDGTSFDHPRFAAMAARAPELFDKLAAAGVAKADLVLAWDFTTASDDMLRGDLTAMRTAALPAIGERGAKLTFTATDQSPSPDSYPKGLLGTFQSPNFLTGGEGPGSVMQRGADGKPELHGLRDAQFAAIIPACVRTQPLPRPTVIFGHGLFGSASELLDDGFVADLAEGSCIVIIAGDFIGLTSRQLATAAAGVSDLNRGAEVTEKLAQSIIDFMALESIARGPMAASPQFQIGGSPVIDPTNTYYVGGSLGGIMGNVLMAYDPNLVRGVLAVPGGNWSMLIERSNAWTLLKGIIQGAYQDPEVYQLDIALFGMGFEPYDPITTAAHVIKDPLFGNPVKNILMWYSIGDCLVSNITTEMVARTMGIDMIGPSVKLPWGLTLQTGAQGNGIVVLDDHPTPLPPDTNEPPAKDNGTHAGINRKPAALRMVESFLLPPTQAAVDGCTLAGSPAACDCATGACD
jgi:pimeloyl-ACP methyl ester carboxylesterase